MAAGDAGPGEPGSSRRPGDRFAAGRAGPGGSGQVGGEGQLLWRAELGGEPVRRLTQVRDGGLAAPSPLAPTAGRNCPWGAPGPVLAGFDGAGDGHGPGHRLQLSRPACSVVPGRAAREPGLMCAGWAGRPVPGPNTWSMISAPVVITGRSSRR